MKSNLSQKIEKFINDEWVKLNQNQITPWAFFSSGKPFHFKTFYGKDISHQGIKYDSSIQSSFWNSYIPPFIEDIVLRSIKYTVTLCKEKQQLSRIPLEEAEELLKSLSAKAYKRMAKIDQALRGNGSPESVSRYDFSYKQTEMEVFITKAVVSEKAMIKKQLWVNKDNEGLKGKPPVFFENIIWLCQNYKKYRTPIILFIIFIVLSTLYKYKDPVLYVGGTVISVFKPQGQEKEIDNDSILPKIKTQLRNTNGNYASEVMEQPKKINIIFTKLFDSISTAIENRDRSALLKLFHPNFQGRSHKGYYGRDKEIDLIFAIEDIRYKYVRIIENIHKGKFRVEVSVNKRGEIFSAKYDLTKEGDKWLIEKRIDVLAKE